MNPKYCIETFFQCSLPFWARTRRQCRGKLPFQQLEPDSGRVALCFDQLGLVLMPYLNQLPHLKQGFPHNFEMWAGCWGIFKPTQICLATLSRVFSFYYTHSEFYHCRGDVVLWFSPYLLNTYSRNAHRISYWVDSTTFRLLSDP